MEHQFGLDAHSKPPDHVRAVYKLFQKWKPGLQKSSQDAHLLDFRAPLPHDVEKRVKTVHRYEASELRSIFAQFIGSSEADFDGGAEPISSSFPVYEHEDCPGKIRNVHRDSMCIKLCSRDCLGVSRGSH